MAKGKVEISAKDVDALLSYVTVNRWLRELRPWTKRHCLRSMVRFTRIAQRDPDNFLAWAKTQDSLEVQDLIDRAAEGLTPALSTLLKADIRSFLRHNGYNNLPKSRLKYTPKDWHRGYRQEEVRKLLGRLDNTVHKLFAYIAIESGLRAQAILDIKWKHVKEDLEAGIIPVAIRFEPEFYARTKAPGFTFLGPHSVTVLKEFLGTRKLKDEDPLVPLKYNAVYDALTRAKQKAGLDKTIQPLHGLRKAFEAALDKAEIDENPKAVIEGHFAGTRARTYTSREWEELRPVYKKAYPYIDPEVLPPDSSWQTERSVMTKKIESLEAKLQGIENLLLGAGKSAGLTRKQLIDALLLLEKKYSKGLPKEAFEDETSTPKKKKGKE